MGVNCTEVLNLVTKLLTVLTIFNGDLPIRVYDIFDPTMELYFLVTFLFNLPVLLVRNCQELLDKAA
jgi:hypothetical protein